MSEKFKVVGIRPEEKIFPKKVFHWYEGKPILSLTIFSIIFFGCLFCDFFITKNPSYVNLANYNIAPNSQYFFGTDTMGRDIFSMIWYGGRISIFIGIVSTILSTFIAVTYGAISGTASERIDTILMRLTEILLSIPNLLLIILIQSTLGKPTIFSIAFVIGITNWLAISKVVRTEVRQMRNSDYIVAARCMGGNFFYILYKHIFPNIISAIMFMVVMNVRSAIVAESTLSFMGIGLPLETISWGSMLSLSEKALLTDAWWIILIPGVFLVSLLLSLTNIGNYLRKQIGNSERIE